jgi:serpin B
MNLKLSHITSSSALATLSVIFGSCGGSDSSVIPVPGEVAVSSVRPVDTPDMPPEQMATLVRGMTENALELFQRGRTGDASVVLSPYSLQVAMGMTFEGARGRTEEQMITALRIPLPKPRLHEGFRALDQIIRRSPNDKVHLTVTNALFGDLGWSFSQDYVDTIALYYRAPLSRLDFAGNPGSSRVAINRWVASKTNQLISDLIPPEEITHITKLVIVNAIHFVGQWNIPFETNGTRDEVFIRPDGSERFVPMMRQNERIPYSKGPDWSAVELPFAGQEFGFLVIVPTHSFLSFTDELDSAKLASIIDGLQGEDVLLRMPRFEVRTPFPATTVLKELGMTDAFDKDRADFSGISPGLSISRVVHEAVLKVDESGTEAAGATAVVFDEDSPPRVNAYVSADRAFVFLLRHRETGLILFLGCYTGDGS